MGRYSQYSHSTGITVAVIDRVPVRLAGILVVRSTHKCRVVLVEPIHKSLVVLVPPHLRSFVRNAIVLFTAPHR